MKGADRKQSQWDGPEAAIRPRDGLIDEGETQLSEQRPILGFLGENP